MPRANPQKQHHTAGDRVNGNAFKLVFLAKERYTFHCGIHILPYINPFHRLYSKNCIYNVQKKKICRLHQDQPKEPFTQNVLLLSKTQDTAQYFSTAESKERNRAVFRDTFWSLNFELDLLKKKKKRRHFCARRCKSAVRCDCNSQRYPFSARLHKKLLKSCAVGNPKNRFCVHRPKESLESEAKKKKSTYRVCQLF